VTSDALWFMTPGGKIAAPIVPPMMNNSGKYVTSLQKLVKWLGEQAESVGVDVFQGSAQVSSIPGLGGAPHDIGIDPTNGHAVVTNTFDTSGKNTNPSG